MSSFLGHAAAGAAIFLCQGPLNTPRGPWVLMLCTLLALAPDFDYLLIWFFNLQVTPRVTHSLAFCLAVSLLAWLLASSHARNHPPLSYSTLALASCSHLPLDLLVGAHSLPVFWPFIESGIASPIGILPGAAHSKLTSYRLWRNLLIECGVLLPLFAVLVARCRGVALLPAQPGNIAIGSLWLACVICSLSLPR